jgi:hypothetical protein
MPNAGIDQTVILPSAANLTGSISDDGLPNPPAAVTAMWSQVSGPGVATFADANALSTTASFSVEGQYVLRLSANDGDLNGSDDLTVNVLAAGTGGALSGSVGAPANAVDLSQEGSNDWAHWGLTSVSSFNHKSGVTQQISNYTRIGGGTLGRAAGTSSVFPQYSWVGGTPTASALNTPSSIYITGAGNGFELTVAADTTERTLRLYVGVWAATGRLEASLSDSSAAAYVNTGLAHGGSGATARGVYTLVYRAASSGQVLRVRWRSLSVIFSSGNVVLQAASLQ